MSRLLIIGPPGAGKGTQAAKLSTLLSVPAISTGDIFREHVRSKSDLGQQVTAIMAAGDYVPDDITNAMLEVRLREDDATHGFILDGYPRTVGQVGVLDTVLGERGTRLDAVVHLTANVDELVVRLSKRAAEQGRDDDTEQVIRRRIDFYLSLTEPLLDLYRARGIVVSVDGLPAVAEVTSAIIDGLRSRTTLA